LSSSPRKQCLDCTLHAAAVVFQVILTRDSGSERGNSSFILSQH